MTRGDEAALWAIIANLTLGGVYVFAGWVLPGIVSMALAGILYLLLSRP